MTQLVLLAKYLQQYQLPDESDIIQIPGWAQTSFLVQLNLNHAFISAPFDLIVQFTQI